jgi:hypothetical protein
VAQPKGADGVVGLDLGHRMIPVTPQGVLPPPAAAERRLGRKPGCRCRASTGHTSAVEEVVTESQGVRSLLPFPAPPGL